LFKATVQSQTGWIVTEDEVSVYILTEDGREYIALSNICTHLGCRVRWIADQNQYFCPCHNAIFDKTGLVLSGPPPKPLDRYETKVEDDQLYILLGG
jgi:Rieske Fe-S protein